MKSEAPVILNFKSETMSMRSILLKCFSSVIVFMTFINGFSQDERDGKFNTGAEICSSYIWRGSKYGTGPAIQPMLEFTAGSFTAGGWGSFDFRGYQETNLYFTFSLPSGFSLGMTDYYSPDLRYFDYSKVSGSHAFEINLSFSKNNFNFSANYILNEAGGVGSLGNDLYFQAGYSFELFSLFVGAGNGWHIYEPDTGRNYFNVCNLGFETSRPIKITDTFSIPVTGQLVFNPDKEQMYIVVGFTF